MKILVNDTNIFLDLQSIGLLDKIFELPSEIHTVDFVVAEIITPRYADEIAEFINEGKLVVRAFTPSEILEIVTEQANAPGNLSITDCSICYYAKSGAYTLITGDRQLRKYAEAQNIEVHGILFILDKMIEYNVINKRVGADKLKELLTINIRLPKLEIDRRISAWSR